MKPFLHYLRTSALIIITSVTTSVSLAATITSVASGKWSASAWPNTTRTGTITTSIASATIMGTGTSFLTQISVGNVIKLTGSNTVIGTVLSITNNTMLILTANAASTNASIPYNVQGIGPSDAALIAGGVTVTVDNATAACISLGTANSGAGASVLAFNSGSHLTVSGVVTIGIAAHAGSINMTSGGILTCHGFTVTNGAVWTPGSGTVELTTSNTLPASFFTSFNNLTILGGITTMAVGLTINSNLSIPEGPSSAFTDGGFALTVSGTTIVGGGASGSAILNLNSVAGAKTFTGQVTIGTGGNWNNTGNAPVTFQGGILNNSTFTAGAGLQTFNTNAQTLSGTLTIPSVTVTGITLTNNSILTVTSALGGSGTLAQFMNATLNLNFTGAPGITGLTAIANGNTVNYGFAGTQTVFATNYYNLTLSNDGVKTLQTGTTAIGGNFDMSGTTSATAVVGLTIGGDVNIIDPTSTFNSGTFTHNITGSLNNNGIVNAGIGTINIGADVINSGTLNGIPGSIVTIGGNVNNSGAFNANQDVIVFNGASLQTITNTGTGSFDNLTVNNTDVGIQLENPITATTSLTMTQGNIDLNGNILSLGISVAQIGTLARTSGTIINSVNGTGSFIRAFNTSTIADGSITGLFPVGTVTNYQPISVSAPVTGPSTGGTIAVGYTDASGNTSVSIPDGASTIVVRKNFFWTLSAGGGIVGGTYNLDAAGTGFGTVGNVNDLRLSLSGSVVGTAGINAGTTINPQVNRINLALADLSNSFFIGSVDLGSSPLPVALISFTATPVNGEVKLDWETASEFNNDHFTILRSVNTVSWESLEVIPGTGNTSVDTKYSAYDEKPYSGISYYRLQQTDLDGRQSYSAIVSVNMGTSASIIIYPNPATDYIFIANISSEKFEVSLFNSNGQQMNIPMLINANNVRLSVSEIPAGTYFLNIIRAGTNETKTVIKK